MNLDIQSNGFICIFLNLGYFTTNWLKSFHFEQQGLDLMTSGFDFSRANAPENLDCDSEFTVA